MERDTPPAAPSSGQEVKHFVSGIFFYFWENSEASMGGGGRAAPQFGVEMSPKRRVRAAHGRAREAKTH